MTVTFFGDYYDVPPGCYHAVGLMIDVPSRTRNMCGSNREMWLTACGGS